MIVIFQLFVSFLYKLCKKRLCSVNPSWGDFTITKEILDSPLAQRDRENDIKFDPPMYKQRYERALAVLLHEKWKDQLEKVVDIGCGELHFFVFLKNKIPAREIIFVDIDEFLLRDFLYRVYPLNADYLIRRETHLTVKVFAGNVAYPDESLSNTDAVVALELIEHLYPDTLEALPYNLFSYVCPKIIIITTPNSEFNVLFENLKTFRHADHKFEWTREQFESWALNLTLRFPRYTVQFDGIGLGLTGSEDFGCCSQLAVFIRKDLICDNYVEEIVECNCDPSTCKSNLQNSICCSCKCRNCLPKASYGVCTYNSHTQRSLSKWIIDRTEPVDGYKLISNIEYAVNTDTRTEEEKVLDELKYRMHLLGSRDDKYYSEERGRVEIPLKALLYVTSKAAPTEAVATSLLLQSNYKIEECLNLESDHVETCVIYEPEMENSGSGSEADASGYESDKNDTDDADLSDWDNKDVTPPNRRTKAGIKAQLRLEVSGSKKPQEALFDSGYQKSPSVPDESPQVVPGRDPIPLGFRSLASESKPNKLSNILSVFDNFDRINELDAVHKDRKHFNFASNLSHNEAMKKLCQEIVKHPIAGPSRDPRRSRISKKAQSSDSDESVEEVKAITTCILENSLNKIEPPEAPAQRANVIQEPIPEEAPLEEVVLHPAEVIVENGDLANNNRDVEGNNYPAEDADAEDLQPENDNAVDNHDRNNVNIDNNNEVADPIPEEHEENVEEEPAVDAEVAFSSREALFDANSQVDLLEEFDVDPPVAVPMGNLALALPSAGCSLANQAVLPQDEIGFPNWLLQIFEEGEVGLPLGDDLHDEPHFYCQGDGLGVHPSTVAVNEDADDEGNGSDSSSSSSSSLDSNERFVNAQNQFANPEDDQALAELLPPVLLPPMNGPGNDDLVLVGQAVPVDVNRSRSGETLGEDESFVTAEGSESNLVPSSCTQ